MARKKQVKKTGVSPYSKYDKTPYRYSQEYRQWFRANHVNIKESAAFNQ